MSVDFGWRRFVFFDKSFVVDPNSGEKYVGLKDVSADSWCKFGDMVFLGERRGGVFRLTSQFQDFFWKPFQRSLVGLTCVHRLLFSVGEDDDTGSILKIWHKIDESQPEVLKSVRLSGLTSGLVSPCTAIAVHSQMTEVVAGFSDGTVLIFQGDVLRDKLDKSSKWLKIFDQNNGEGPVEGIAVSHLPGDRTVVFVILTKNVYSYVLENKAVLSKVKHFSSGANRDCWTFNEKLGQLAIANKEMVYLYDAERSAEVDGGHGRCYQLGKGFEKMQLVWFGEYLVLLTKQQAIIAAGDEKFMSVVTVYDTKNQYVAFSCSLPTICRMFILGSALMVLNDKDGTLSELKEKALSSKLEILFKKKFFDVALSLAKNSKEGQLHEQAIHCKYADHLYAKGDFDNAIDHYKGTIGMLEPSYVMKRFHDESRLRQLCVYLEALHERKVYNKHQTEILLRTYARLGDEKKLLAFVKKMATFPDAEMSTAFKILREANPSSKDASILAVQLKLPQEALTCMVEDLKEYRTAVLYIGKLSPEIATEMVEKYGRILMENSPERMIPLLQNVLQDVSKTDMEFSQFLSPFDDLLANNEDFINFLLTMPPKKIQKEVDRLLEIRLRALSTTEDITEEQWKALFALAEAATPDVALQLVRIFRCLPAEHRLMQANDRWKELAQFLLKHGELDELIEICKKKNESQMWLDAMVSIAQRQEVTEKELRTFLQEVEAADALHPLLVLEVLSGSETIKISAVKPYIINWLQRQNVEIEKNSKAVEEAEKRMVEITEQAESLKFEPQTIQVSKCSACDVALQLPAVHFLCKHSYHVHCFESYSEKADACPACVTPLAQSVNNENILRTGHSRFVDQLNNSVNGMEIVAKFIRMGLFDNHKKPSMRTSAGGNSFATERQSSESGSNLASRGSETMKKFMPNTNPFEETVSSRRSTQSQNSFQEPAHGTKSRASTNPFASINPFDE